MDQHVEDGNPFTIPDLWKTSSLADPENVVPSSIIEPLDLLSKMIGITPRREL